MSTGCNENKSESNSNSESELVQKDYFSISENKLNPSPDPNCTPHLILAGFGDTENDPEYPKYRDYCPISTAVNLAQMRFKSPAYFESEKSMAGFTRCRSLNVVGSPEKLRG